MNKKKFTIDWGNAMSKIKEQEAPSKNSFKDERIYYPQFNDNGTAQAVIRFLPSPDTDIPFVKVYSHSIKGIGGWFIENCPTTLKKECPACKANSAIWNSDPETARSRKRKQNFYSNILVMKDPANPENVGKVFLFKYGFKVHQKIMEKIQPEENAIKEPVMIFDYYDGANFDLVIKKIKVGSLNLPNYDSCEFEAPSPVGTDAEIEKIHKSLYSLNEFLQEDKFKPYADLEAKFRRVVGAGAPSAPRVAEHAKAPVEEKVEETATVTDSSVFDDGEDNFFDNLKKED